MVIVVLLGKSGCGKSTVEKSLENIGFSRIISYTTRKIRAGEENHREYHFINEEQFKKLKELGIIIEEANYNGNLYGASKPVGCDKNVVVMESDGLEKMRSIYKNQVFAVYINTPDEEISNRLNKRNNTTDIDLRKAEDEKKFRDIESKVDYIADGTKTPTDIVIDIVNQLNIRGMI